MKCFFFWRKKCLDSCGVCVFFGDRWREEVRGGDGTRWHRFSSEKVTFGDKVGASQPAWPKAGPDMVVSIKQSQGSGVFSGREKKCHLCR